MEFFFGGACGAKGGAFFVPKAIELKRKPSRQMIREAFCTHGFSTDTFGHDTHHTALALSLILRSDNVSRNLTLRRSVEDGAENAGPVPALHDGGLDHRLWDE